MQILVYALTVLAAGVLVARAAMVVYMRGKGVYPSGIRGVKALADRAEELQDRRDRLVLAESALTERRLMLDNLLDLAAKARPLTEAEDAEELERLRARAAVYDSRFAELRTTIADGLGSGAAGGGGTGGAGSAAPDRP
ncbi:hypothetical protein ACFPZ0_11570 [Streptomonospora nanhaiensis]|uniref:Uncharacterized protein n=1 Tax=Streptomonospora nanhaiensis TaxID=1323731 RepID=A0A853BPV1_9ACTN|nr:hypothetical protein [Streptomonospora nanhaiensis]MBV2365745.1 hypothetical protein [Streptomonospora nanhaiensis]MBX9388900.1 hypothetical protein [Streptomonospora nanhaiensis]NYI96541.1 hypothetical protein [Streptomonospora nanhaiensis]